MRKDPIEELELNRTRLAIKTPKGEVVDIFVAMVFNISYLLHL
jgi:hypothetical protein